MRLIVFDVDGTLVDSQHQIHAAVTEAFADAGLPAPTLAEVHGIIGLSLPVALARLLPELSSDEVGRIVASYKNSFLAKRLRDDAPLFPGALDCLRALAGREDTILGVATGKGRRGLLSMLEHHGLGGFFHTLQCADDHPSKPHPGMVLAAMAEAGVGPQATMMVGDTNFDIEMGCAAGVRAIGVGWGYHRPEALHTAGAAAIAPDFGGLQTLIADWSAEVRAA